MDLSLPPQATSMASMPSKDEQRRMAAVQIALATRGEDGYDNVDDLVRDAGKIAHFIDRG